MLKMSLILAGCLVLPAFLSAQNFLNIDFNAGSGDPSPTQSGFLAVNTSTSNISGPISQPFSGLSTEFTTNGSLTLTIARGTSLTATGDITARDRGAIATDEGTFTYSAIYRDMLQPQGNGSTANTFLEFSGLLANTSYEIRFFAYDHNAASSRTMHFTDYTTGSNGNTGSVTFTGSYGFTSTTDNNIFSTTISVTSDTDGKVVIRANPGGNYGLALNAIQIAAIPEPATTTFAILSLVLLATLFPRCASHRNSSRNKQQ